MASMELISPWRLRPDRSYMSKKFAAPRTLPVPAPPPLPAGSDVGGARSNLEGPKHSNPLSTVEKAVISNFIWAGHFFAKILITLQILKPGSHYTHGEAGCSDFRRPVPV